MNTLAARWGHLIHTKRRAAGLSQVELGKRIGRPQPTISRWEGGRTVPSPADQERLYRVLELTADDLAAVYGGEAVA